MKARNEGRRLAWLLWAAMAAVLMLFSVAVAQDGEFTFDPMAWGRDPVLATLTLAGAVAWLRQTPLGRAVDGAARVALVTGAVGALAGALLQVREYLAVDPYAGWPIPWGGIAYGLAIAVNAVFGVSLFNYGAKKVSLAVAGANTNAAPSLTGVPVEALTNAAVEWVLKYVRGLVSEAQVPSALRALAPLISELLQSNLVLNDEVRAELQGRVLTLLRKAGLVGKDL